MIFYIAAIHGIILGLLVANHKKYGKPLSNKILGLAIFLFSLCLAEYGLYTSGQFIKVPYLITSTNVFLFSVPALFYLYIKSRLSLKINRIDYLSFVPALVYLLFALPFYILSSDEKLQVLYSNQEAYAIFNKFWAFYYVLLWILFGVLSLKTIDNRKIKNSLNTNQTQELQWLKRLMLLFMIVALFDVAIYFLGTFISSIKTITAYITTSIHALIIYLLGYLAILNPKMFFDQKPSQYVNSSLSKSISEELSQKIIRYMESNRPYLDSTLRMNMLAKELNISSNQLSQVLNDELKQSFNEFVNQYRVEEVKQKLGDTTYDHLTILAIAEECGFNSKNAFNRAFKNHTGKTPSQFKKEVNSTSS